METCLGQFALGGNIEMQSGWMSCRRSAEEARDVWPVQSDLYHLEFPRLVLNLAYPSAVYGWRSPSHVTRPLFFLLPIAATKGAAN